MNPPLSLRALALLTLISMISACSTVGKNTSEQTLDRDWAQYQLEANRVATWDLRGRAVVFVENTVHQIGLSWQTSEIDYSLTLEAPFGQGVFRVESNFDGDLPFKLSLPNDRVVYGETAEAVLEEVLGWSIPVSGLHSWIKGLPDQSSDYHYRLDSEGRLRSLRQAGWQINYIDYFEVSDDGSGEQAGLPRRLHLERDQITLKLVVESWQKPIAVETDTGAFPQFN